MVLHAAEHSLTTAAQANQEQKGSTVLQRSEQTSRRYDRSRYDCLSYGR